MSTPANTPAETPEKKYEGPVIGYALSNGELTRTDKDSTIIVAHYDEKKQILSLVEQWAKFRAPAMRWLNENGIEIKAVVMEGDESQAEREIAREASIPPKPKKDMRFGDKTPALVEWYKKYKPAEYKARYGIIGPGTVTKYRKELDDDGKPVSKPYTVEATLSQRKTHLTEKVEAGESEDSEYNDK